MMKNDAFNDRKDGKIELLAPAGSVDAGYAALHYGADAVYLGLENFSARASAVNFSINDLADITGYAHAMPKRRKIYAAVNTLILQNEFEKLIDLLALIADIGVDAVIVQDLGVLNILRRYFPQIKIHASTQMAVHNLYGAEAARNLGITRVTLARELTLAEISGIAAKSGIETEIFIHGALCYSYSGLCLFSSHLYGRSGNRGKCAYPCREWFGPGPRGDNNGRDGVTPSGSRGQRCHHAAQTGGQHARPSFEEKSSRSSGSSPNLTGKHGGFIFSMKDLALPEYVAELRRAGVTALKIEGRMKSPLYVAAAVNYYRHLIDGRLSPDKERELASDVKTIFSRPWTDLYLKTRRKCGVIDTETQGHRGAPAGRVEEIAKNSGGHCLRFKTDLPIELHDGLQIDIAGLPRPFGFAVKNINIMGDMHVPGKKRVFTAPAGARVEIQLPRGHPAIPLGTVIYSSSSQKVKQQYDFFKPKRGQFRFRQAADFEISVEASRVDVTASANVFYGKGEKVCVETQKHFDGFFEPAQNIGQVAPAIATAFGKLGDTNLKLGKLAVSNPHNLFIPISLLNSIRREISAALEQKIAELPRGYASVIKSEIISDVIPDLDRESRIISSDKQLKLDSRFRGNDKKNRTSESENQITGKFIHDHFNWSIKTDQPRLLEAFDADDWRDIDEVIIECGPDVSPEFIDRLDRSAGKAGKSHLRLALPVIMRQWETEYFTKAVSDLTAQGRRKWQVSNLGGWALLDNIQKRGIHLDISSDWPLYAMNRTAVLELNAMGISRFTLSPEDGFENMRALLAEFSESAVVIVYQDTPLMISETCIFASEKCSRQNAGNCEKTQFVSPHGDKIRVISRNCRSIVFNNRPFCLSAHLKELSDAGAVNFRADFVHRGYSEKEALAIWRKLRSGAPMPSGHNANFDRAAAQKAQKQGRKFHGKVHC